MNAPRNPAHPPRVRLFVALELPGAAVDALVTFRDAAVAADDAVWRPVADASLHVTLVFIGQRDPTAVETAGAALRAAAAPPASAPPAAADPPAAAPHANAPPPTAAPPPTDAPHANAPPPAPPAPRLTLAGALLLPPRRPSVLAAALADPDGTLAALQARVSGALAGAGLHEPEARPFRPHVTVARLRPRARAPRHVDSAPEPIAFAATSVTLFASRPRPSGAHYEALVRVPFAPHS